jgi:hypothetical protein
MRYILSKNNQKLLENLSWPEILIEQSFNQEGLSELEADDRATDQYLEK